MSLETYIAFVFATAALALLPGPIVSLIIANGTSFGTRAAFTTIAGSTSGLAVMTAVAALGMGSLLAVMSEWFDYIRWAGAAYLIWLGLSRLWHGWRGGSSEEPETNSHGRLYWQGLVAALANPKVMLFLGAFFPQFINPNAAAGPQIWLLAITFVVTAGAMDSIYGALAGNAQRWFTDRRRRFADMFGGVLLVIGGVWLAFTRRA